MLTVLKNFWQDEDGMGTVEIVLIVAVLVGIALLFKGKIGDFVKNATNQIFSDDIITKVNMTP